MKTIIIGDIHGCDQALHAILEKVQPADDDRLILLGDLFDRGPESWEVFQSVRKLAETLGQRFVLLRGNHEDYLLQPRLSFAQRLVWDRVGRGTTVKSFKAHNERMENAIPWLMDHCRLFWRGNGLQCVHAGLRSESLEDTDAYTLLHDHGVALENCYAGPLTVVGHIALEIPTWFKGDGKTVEMLQPGEWLPLPKTGIICIDTGCGKGGRLTAMIAEGERFRLENVHES